MKKLLLLLFVLSFLACEENANKEFLDYEEVRLDLKALTKYLDQKSAYHHVTDFDYKEAFDKYLKKNEGKEFINKAEFGIYLDNILGEFGDRHAYAKGFELKDVKYLPFTLAPLNDNVLVLDNEKCDKEYYFWNINYPYLKEIDLKPIEYFALNGVPRDKHAPDNARFLRGLNELRDVSRIYTNLNLPLKDSILFTFTDVFQQKDTTFYVKMVERKERGRIWKEKIEAKYSKYKAEDYNNKKVCKKLFSIKDSVAYLHVPEMFTRKNVPGFFNYFNTFMKQIKNSSKALILDVRGNKGGYRDFTYDFAKYVIHPDSIYITNAARFKGAGALTDRQKIGIESRQLVAEEEMNEEEKLALEKFNQKFNPKYTFEDGIFGSYYYMVFNGKKTVNPDYYYDKPIYILCNEKSRSATSVLVAAFKGLPNITIVGEKIDGSSSVSPKIHLPHSRLELKISIMISYQKDGNLFDCVGTDPDIEINRDIDQVFWIRDTQLEKLKQIIKERNNDV
ncbi:S41 family peptidase [Aureivirga sp. CE67]|uniref:S41 family peptidase n=1 Tax=Aureivirga sp. CE67 TaxID=1788983 RepID=UPI0018CB709F|nr:S41 family peptidase [Aureivirga sp. CE67]